MTNPTLTSAILIAADSIEQLRKSDVFRVLSENATTIRSDLAAYITAQRPDLANEVIESLADCEAA